MPFYPGPGLGGHCIPIDPFYLSWKLKTLNYDAKFIGLAGDINGQMPQHVVRRIQHGLNTQKKSVNGSKVLILGAAYKADVNDVRESPARDIMLKLMNMGADLTYNDDYVHEVNLKDANFKSVPLTKTVVQEADCVVIVTRHSYLDVQMIFDNAKLIVDSRNALKGMKSDKIIRI
jgi:UDP-N-acetyl-D-glucosamine dehydrogenase